MRPGPEVMAALRAEVGGRLVPGDELIAAGAAGIKETAVLIKKEYEILRKYFSESFLREAGRLYKKYSAAPVPEEKFPVYLSFPVGEGGVLAALWKAAEASECGLKADLRKIPVRQETIEICERLTLDPYKLSGGGSVLIAAADARPVLGYYQAQGIPAAVIGEAVSGSRRLLYSGDIVRYLERPREILSAGTFWGNEGTDSEKQQV